MQETDKIKMRIKIAGLNIPLTVAFKEQDNVRETEARIAELFDNWRRMFPAKSTEELLAMMTYQYASYYLALSRSRDDIAQGIESSIAELDKVLLRTDPDE